MIWRRKAPLHSTLGVREPPSSGGAGGPDGRAVGRVGTVASHAADAQRSPRPPLARSPRRAERHPVDPPDRRSVEGSARPVSILSDLPSTVSAQGGERDARAGAPRPRAGCRRAGRVGPRGVLPRRHVRRRENGGALVGTTKRGKKTKIMAIADRAGLPVAVGIASARRMK